MMTVVELDVLGPLTLTARREARLLAEHARLYPGIAPGVWESAAMLADRVLADELLRGVAIGRRHRVLHDGHFEFRGGEPEPHRRPMREDR